MRNFFGTKFRGGQNFLFMMGGFPNERECSGADWLDPLIGNQGRILKIIGQLYFTENVFFFVIYKFFSSADGG